MSAAIPIGRAHGGSLVQQAMDAVSGYIREQALRVGDTLPGEAHFATELGVSRAVMREAFGALAALKLIDVGNGRKPRVGAIDGISTCSPTSDSALNGKPVLFQTNDRTFLAHEELRHEVFGPSTILVRCESMAHLLEVAQHLEGTLTATIHGTQRDLTDNRPLLTLLTRKAGRLVFNGFPTGVEVCASMQHGGPYPATTDARFTSVGTAAIQRFARPICFQDCPPEFLPTELQAL